MLTKKFTRVVALTPV